MQICDVCRESFEQCWSEERESWHLKDAVSVNGKVGHLECIVTFANDSLITVCAYSRINFSCSYFRVASGIYKTV